MSAIGNVVFEIDEELANAMALKVIDNNVLEIIAKKVGVPVVWVKDRYEEMCNDW